MIRTSVRYGGDGEANSVPFLSYHKGMNDTVRLKYRKEYKHAGEAFSGRIVKRKSDGAKCFRFFCEQLGKEIEVLLDAFEPV